MIIFASLHRVFVFIRNSRRCTFVFKWSLRDPCLKRIVYVTNQEYKVLIHAYFFSVSTNISAWHSESRAMHYKSSLYKKINQNEIQGQRQHSKFSAFPSFLFTDFTYCYFYLFPGWTCYCFTNCVLFSFFFYFFWSLSRSRSHPVPHRGERVKQGKVHARNISVITKKTFLSCYILRHVYAVIIAGWYVWFPLLATSVRLQVCIITRAECTCSGKLNI
jgi:hypothetical protein